MTNRQTAADKDRSHPWMQPLWVRVAILAVCVAWCVVEFMSGSPFWGILAGAAACYALWTFFLTWEKKPQEEDG